jgi:uncharacterized protein (DUF1778 family)
MPSNSRTRAMQIVSVRFGTAQIRLIQNEAETEGVSTSQFIRDAAFARAILLSARRNRSIALLWEKLIAVVEEAGADEISVELRDLLPAAAVLDQDDPGAQGADRR